VSSLRYCGDLRIRVVYIETTDTGAYAYRVYVRPRNETVRPKTDYTPWVGVVHSSGHHARILACDSTQIVDAIAASALPFARNDGFPVEDFGEFDDVGAVIRRSQ
jgi:hypothetical protein